MPAVVDSPLTLRRGYGFTFGIRFTTASDLSGAEVTWVLADGQFSGARLILSKSAGDNIDIGPDGLVANTWLITVVLEEADTVHIPSGTYYHECKVSPTGSESHCPASGTVTVVDSPIPPLVG